jgi:hypothetical protein
MPVVMFDSATDGFEPRRKSREPFTANTNFDDERRCRG